MKPLLVAVAFLRIDIESGKVTGRQWEPDGVIEAGSLAKPFIALAYAQNHEFDYPRVLCRTCWLPRGHGRAGIRDAIANSCNSYFDELLRGVTPAQIDAVANRFGLPQAGRALPEQILRAYIELSRRGAEPGVAPLLEGMRLAAHSGTAKGVAKDALAKTGTAACSHHPKAPGDGFAVVLHPAVKPAVALLVRVHSRPGAFAAAEAARLLP